MKHDIDNGQGHWKAQGVPYIVYELWSTNRLKLDRSFTYFSVLFRPSPLRTLYKQH